MVRLESDEAQSSMKTLDSEQAISLLPPDDELTARAIVRLEDLMGLNSSIEELQASVSRGEIQSVAVEVEPGKPLFVIWFFLSASKTLCVAGASVSSEDNFDSAIQAVEIVARQAGAKFIEFRTKRRGLARKAAAFGFVADTVNLVKKVH